MKMVFEKFDTPLYLTKNAINVIRIQSPSLYSRCVVSLVNNFTSGCPEPAYLFDNNNHEIAPSKSLLVIGDLVLAQLNDRQILNQAFKVISERINHNINHIQQIEQLHYQIEDIFQDEFIQMSANYSFLGNWDCVKYLKMLDLSFAENSSISAIEKALQILDIASDLFSEKIICFINLKTYLSDKEYNEFCEQAIAHQLCVLSYEQNNYEHFTNLENGLFVDIDYIENTNYSEDRLLQQGFCSI